ncbi:MAG: MFS transporter [Paludibacteraceae bacterium]
MKPNKNLYIIFSVTLFAVMGVASITPAFPEIIRYFEIKPHQVGGLIVAFTLPGIFLTPFTGILADRYGRKIVLIPSLLLFGLAGFACMFTKDFYWLLVLRFVQGIGASSLSSINTTLIGDLFEGKQRVSAMGYNAGVQSIGTASYPALGGIIAHWGWQYIFLLPILAVPVAIWALDSLDSPKIQQKSSLKLYFGNLWKTINQRKVWALLSVNIIVFIILYGAYLTYFPLMMEERLMANSLHIGLMMSLMSISTAVVSTQLARIQEALGQKRQLILGSLGYFAASALLAYANDYWILIAALIIFGAAHGITLPMVQNMLVGYAATGERAAFMSLNSMMLRGGQTLGPVIVGLGYAAGGLQASFWTGAVFAFGMMLIIVFMMGSKGTKSKSAEN